MDLSAFPDAPSVDESASSLEENAALKALSAHDYTGLWALGDDTGLCIDALNGQPGVRSARFAGTNKDDTRQSNPGASACLQMKQTAGRSSLLY